METSSIKSNENNNILNSYRPLVKSISKIVGPNCQVALHSIAKGPQSCIEIENGDITGESIESPMSPFVKDILKDAKIANNDSIGVYYTKTNDGRPLKSVTSIIRNSENQVIGCLCIYIDVSIPLHEFVQNYLPVVDDGLADALSDHLDNGVNDVDQLIYTTLEKIIADVNNYREISGVEKNRKIVKELNNKGIFAIRGAVEIIAKQLGVSRYTIYNYIKEAEI